MTAGRFRYDNPASGMAAARSTVNPGKGAFSGFANTDGVMHGGAKLCNHADSIFPRDRCHVNGR